MDTGSLLSYIFLVTSYNCLLWVTYSCFAILPTRPWGSNLCFPDEDSNILHSTILGTNYDSVWHLARLLKWIKITNISNDLFPRLAKAGYGFAWLTHRRQDSGSGEDLAVGWLAKWWPDQDIVCLPRKWTWSCGLGSKAILMEDKYDLLSVVGRIWFKMPPYITLFPV